MNNNEFMGKKEEEKRNKLLRVLNSKLPTANVEELVKVVMSLNLKRQYNIRVVNKFDYVGKLAINENISFDEDINGIKWQTTTNSSVQVISGDIVPGSYSKINDEESCEETQVNSSPEEFIAFTKEIHNLGYLNVDRPEYENYLYLYKN